MDARKVGQQSEAKLCQVLYDATPVNPINHAQVLLPVTQSVQRAGIFTVELITRLQHNRFLQYIKCTDDTKQTSL